MSETWKVQASFKFGQHQSGLLNVRADNAQELKDQLGTLSLLDALGDVQATADTLVALGNVAAGGLTQQSTPTPTPSAPAASPATDQWGAPAAPAAPPAAAPQTAAPSCVHGVRTFRSGAGAKGPWKAWMCPAQREDPSKCEPQWIR